MASTFSPTLRLELIGDGDQSGIWGQTTNSNLGTLLEQAITGVQAITMSDANYTLTSFNGVADEARNAVLVFSGTLSQQRNVIAPLVEKTYIIKNLTTGGFNIQIIGASGTGVVIPNGVTASVYCDGTNFYPTTTGSLGNQTINGNLSVTGTTNLTGALTASTATFSGTVALGGTPTAPTAAPGTNTTQIATTAYVLTNGIPSGVIVMWSGSIASIPSGWFLCNGSNGTPDLRDRFVVGAGSTYAVNATGGSANSIVVNHTHTGTTSTIGNHQHYLSGQGVIQGAQLPSFPNNSIRVGAAVSEGGMANENFEYIFQAASGSAEFGLSSANGSHNHTFTTDSSGSGNGVGANLPPYYALAYIMKA